MPLQPHPRSVVRQQLRPPLGRVTRQPFTVLWGTELPATVFPAAIPATYASARPTKYRALGGRITMTWGTHIALSRRDPCRQRNMLFHQVDKWLPSLGNPFGRTGICEDRFSSIAVLLARPEADSAARPEPRAARSGSEQDMLNSPGNRSFASAMPSLFEVSFVRRVRGESSKVERHRLAPSTLPRSAWPQASRDLLPTDSPAPRRGFPASGLYQFRGFWCDR